MLPLPIQTPGTGVSLPYPCNKGEKGTKYPLGGWDSSPQKEEWREGMAGRGGVGCGARVMLLALKDVGAEGVQRIFFKKSSPNPCTVTMISAVWGIVLSQVLFSGLFSTSSSLEEMGGNGETGQNGAKWEMAGQNGEKWGIMENV